MLGSDGRVPLVDVENFIAEARIARASRGYEPREVLLLHSAIDIRLSSDLGRLYIMAKLITTC